MLGLTQHSHCRTARTLDWRSWLAEGEKTKDAWFKGWPLKDKLIYLKGYRGVADSKGDEAK